MQLTLTANNAHDLAAQVKCLAQILGVDPSQLPLPVATNSPEVAPTLAQAVAAKEDQETKETKSEEEKPKAQKKGGKGSKKGKETKSMNGEPAATINWSGEGDSQVLEDPHPSEVAEKPTEDKKEITKQAVADACQKVSTEKNLDTARSILTKFQSSAGEPCKRISELQPNDYAAFIEACEKAVK